EPPEKNVVAPSYRATRLEIDPTAYVAPGAALVGEVSLGRNASVWFHATLRGDMEPIAIGAESNVQDGCVVGRPRSTCTTQPSWTLLSDGCVVHVDRGRPTIAPCPTVTRAPMRVGRPGDGGTRSDRARLR